MTKVMKVTTEMEDLEKGCLHVPDEILSCMFSNLSLKDNARARCVCTKWKAIMPPMLPPPCLIYVGQQDLPCRLYNPIQRIVCSTDVLDISDAIIRYSNAGWLLLSRGLRSMFFFNPLTKEKINLPDLTGIDNGDGFTYDWYDFKSICFSSSPTSSDCTVFGTFSTPIILYISRGEDSWSSYNIAINLPPEARFNETGTDDTSPVFHNGVFYCMGDRGRLGVFDPKEEILWKVFDRPQVPCNNTDLNDEFYMMECDGKLVSVFVGKVGDWVSVFVLNETSMCWEILDDLGDYMLFVSRRTSFAVKKMVDGMENKIYFPRLYRNEGLVYSLKTNKFESFRGKWSKKDFYSTQLFLNCSWIEPNTDTHTAAELDWDQKPIAN